MDNEIWKDVVGYEGFYLVSNLGRLKTVTRKVNHKHSGTITKTEKLLSKNISNSGYEMKCLYKNSSTKSVLVHRLVAEAFIPNPENKPQVNHINGIKSDNRVENLEWNTRSENMRHSYAKGLSKCGIKHYKAKLTPLKVLAIKRLLRIKPKTNKYRLAEKVGVTNGVIYQIINGTTWSQQTL